MRKPLSILTLLFLIFCTTGGAIGNPVIHWNNEVINATRLSRNPAPVAGVHLATFNVTVYEVVNSFDREYEPWLVKDRAPKGAHRDAAIASAAYTILMHIWGNEVNPRNFKKAYDEALEAIPDGKGKDKGVAWGKEVAHRVLKDRSDSGMNLPLEGTYSSTEIGKWRETPLGFRPPVTPRLGDVRPFALHSASQFRAPPHPPLYSMQYADELEFVNQVGIRDGSRRSEYQTLSTPFWSDDLGTSTPPGHWNIILQGILKDLNMDKDVNKTAHTFALLNIAGADAGMTAWETKYYYNIWRPETAIREMDKRINPHANQNPDFIPNMESPAFPTYTSGHSCYTAAMTRMIEHCIGRNEVEFTAISDGLPGVVRSYTSLSDARWEVGMSRVWGGIHTMSDNIEGQKAGIAVADWIFANKLQPLN